MKIKKRGLFLILLLVIPIVSAQYEAKVSITEQPGPEFVRTNVNGYDVALTITTEPVGTKTQGNYETCVGFFCLPYAFSLFSIKGWKQVYGGEYGIMPYGKVTRSLLMGNTIEIQNNGGKKIGVKSDSIELSGLQTVSASAEVSCSYGEITMELLGDTGLLGQPVSSSSTSFVEIKLENIDVGTNTKASLVFYVDSAETRDTRYTCYIREPMLVKGPFVFPYDSNLADLESNWCCPENQCWDGLECVPHEPSQRSDSSLDKWLAIENPTGMTYRCVEGQWQQNTIKYTWDNSLYGRCYDNSDCLVNPRIGDENTLQVLNDNDPNTNDYMNNINSKYSELITSDSPSIRCISNQDYLADHYCNTGEWETRSRDIALTMLDVADRADSNSGINFDYVLFCDNYENVLNLYTYSISTVPLLRAQDFIRGKEFTSGYSLTGTSTIYSCILNQDGTREGPTLPCANNFCILKFSHETEDKILLGTSLNKPINVEPRAFLQVLDANINDCDNVITDHSLEDNYFQCNNNPKIWYNPVKQNVIYANDQSPSLLTGPTLITVVKNPIDSIINFVLNIWRPKYVTMAGEKPYDFIKQTKDFNKLYIEQKTGTPVKTIYGFSEKKAEAPGRPVKEYMSLEFTNFADSYIQEAVETFRRTPPGADIAVTSSNGKQTIVTQDPKAIEKWAELTAELRVQPGTS